MKGSPPSLFSKLKRRLTLLSAGAIMVTLALGLVAFNIEGYQSHRIEIVRAMNYALNADSKESIVANIGGFEDDDGTDEPIYDGSILVYCVEVWDTGEIIVRSGNVYMDSDVLMDVLAIITLSGQDSGEIASYNLFYSSRQIEGGVRYAFTDSSYLQSYVYDRAIFSLVLFGLIGIVVVIICYKIAGIAVRPVEQAWRSQQRFIADASHELKTPLTVILADSDIVKSKPQATVEEQMRWIDGIKDEGTKMQSLVQDLLLLTQTELGADPSSAGYAQESVDLSGAVEMGILQFEALAFENGVLVDDDIEQDLFVIGDVSRVDRVIRILIDNAIKYCKPQPSETALVEPSGGEGFVEGGSGNVKVVLRRDRNKAVLTVNNGGPIISAEDLPHVFDRFYRADKSRTGSGKSKSFGLGLAIARNIVVGMGGTITAESNQQNGTTFTVKLPLE